MLNLNNSLKKDVIVENIFILLPQGTHFETNKKIDFF